MRKMPYAIIFIVILAILVFAGCKAFKLGGDDTTSEPDESVSETFESEATLPEETTTLPSVPEEVTDEAGQTVYTPEEVSSVYDAISASAEASESISANPDAQTAASTTASAVEGTTKTPDPSTTEASAESTTAAPVKPTVNEYDVLRSGKFYLVGSMYSEGETNPITLGVAENFVYMQATMDGATMGFLIQDKKTYLLNPVQKTYCEFGSMMSSILQQAGMMSEDEILEFIDEMGFSSMDDLSDADEKTEGTIGSTACDVYIFNKTDGTKTRVYMNGNRLMAFEVVGTNGLVDSATYITSLSDEIPTMPPQDYEKQNVITFMTSMEEIIGE